MRQHRLPVPTRGQLSFLGDVLAAPAIVDMIPFRGWREQGVQVVDLKTRKVTQTLVQNGAFYGAAFSPDGHRLCVPGGDIDLVFLYAWKDGGATLENKIELAKATSAARIANRNLPPLGVCDFNH